MWLQGRIDFALKRITIGIDPFIVTDIPDQPAILRQYMRHTSQIGSAKTVEKSVKRALQMYGPFTIICCFAISLLRGSLT